MNALVIALIEQADQEREVSTILRDAGHTVISARNFLEAKAALQRTDCDLILSDVHLQNGGNVFDFLKWVKTDPRLRQIPFVLVSFSPSQMAKYLRDGLRVASRHLGAAKYIDLDSVDPVLLMEELAEFLPDKDSVPAKR